MDPPRTTIVHLITGVEIGGAEVMLARLLENADHTRFRHAVICLKGRGSLAGRLEAGGAEPFVSLGIRGPLSACRGLFETVRLLRSWPPALVQLWLAHALFFGSLAAVSAGRAPVVWCLHTGNQDPSRIRRSVKLLYRFLAGLSHVVPRTILSVSEAATTRARGLGFCARKIRFLPNGTDASHFRPLPVEGRKLRESLGIGADDVVVGFVGRNTPEKDLATFFRAAGRVLQELPQCRFLLCGEGLNPSMPEADGIPPEVLSTRFHFLGLRHDVERVYNACSLVALTSTSEAFPLVLGEAMACGVPVAATDVGDCHVLVGDGRTIAPPGDPSRIAETWLAVLRASPEERERLGHATRDRIEQHYSMRQCIREYEHLYDQLRRKPSTSRSGPGTAAAPRQSIRPSS